MIESSAHILGFLTLEGKITQINDGFLSNLNGGPA